MTGRDKGSDLPKDQSTIAGCGDNLAANAGGISSLDCHCGRRSVGAESTEIVAAHSWL